MKFNTTELSEEFQRHAEWRREKAQEYPDDARNLEAAAIFDKLADSAGGVDREWINEYAELFDDVSDAEAWNELMKQVGFHWWPATAKDAVSRFIAERTGADSPA